MSCGVQLYGVDPQFGPLRTKGVKNGKISVAGVGPGRSGQSRIDIAAV